MSPIGRASAQVCAIFVLCHASHLQALPPPSVLERISPERLEPTEVMPLSPSATPPATASQPPFPSHKVLQLSVVAPQSFSTNATCTVSPTNVCANDIWGYVSPSGREYAILGLRTGTGFVDVTNPVSPVVVGSISDATSTWSDMRTYGQYAYNVNESGGGLQVIDLSQIDPPTRQVTLVRSVTQSGLATVHTLAVNPASGYLYLCGSNLGGGRLVAMSLADPSNPVIVGQALQAGYVHAAQVVSYTSGPYAGREIAFCYCGSLGLRILDVTNKSNMFTMGSLVYPNTSYTHQGWLTHDQKYVLINDELDEVNNPNVNTTTTYVVNVENLSNPQFVTTFTNGMPTIDHNLMIRNYPSQQSGIRSFVFEANYTSGMRIYNVTDVTNAFEVGWIDTYTFNNGLSFNGAWGVYSALPSGNILISDMQAGLVVVDPSEAVAENTCEVASAPMAAPGAPAKNRYVSFVPSSPGVQTAVRVKLADLPAPFQGMESTFKWVALPQDIVDTVSPPTTIKRSRLTCEPVYADWGSMGTIRIADDDIVPGGVYEIQQIETGCDQGAEQSFSSAASVSAATKWGDVVGGNPSEPPDGDANFVDIAAIVDKFKAVAGAVGIDVADLQPSEPDGVIDFVDISHAVDAFRGFAYPFGGPTSCP